MGWIREARVFAANTLGNLIFAVRRDTPSPGTGVDDGDIGALSMNSAGALYVTAASGSSGTAIDDAAFTPATSTGTVIMGFADETAPDSVNEGDAGAIRMTLPRALHVNLRNSSGVEVASDATNGLDVDVTRVAVPTAIFHGQTTVTTAGTEVALGSSQAITQGVLVKALHNNTGFVYVGGNPVTSATGLILDAGESIFVPVANVATVFIDVSVNGEGASWLAS